MKSTQIFTHHHHQRASKTMSKLIRFEAMSTFCMVMLFSASLSFIHIWNPKGSQRSLSISLAMQKKETVEWPGTRPPITNMETIDQRMDAAWGRAKYRTEVWEDDVNPSNDWWLAYAPSEEEISAAEKGFDFKNPQSWFESRGIDYDKALAESNALSEKLYQEFVKEKESQIASFSMEEFLALQEDFFAMQRRAFEVAFRLEDDKKQAAKGQPSLSIEDTGKQWKNDPV